MRIILTFLLFIVGNQVFAQTGTFFKGTINKTIKVSLYLQGLDVGTHADPISGAYKYDNRNEYILLHGYRNNNENIVLVELASANFSGVFMGTMNKKTIKGNWTSADGRKTYPFVLVEVTATKEQLVKFQNAMENKAKEFSSY